MIVSFHHIVKSSKVSNFCEPNTSLATEEKNDGSHAFKARQHDVHCCSKSLPSGDLCLDWVHICPATEFGLRGWI